MVLTKRNPMILIIVILIILIVLWSLILITKTSSIAFGIIAGGLIISVIGIFLLIVFIKGQKSQRKVTALLFKNLGTKISSYQIVSGIFLFFGVIYNLIKYIKTSELSALLYSLIFLTGGCLLIFTREYIARFYIKCFKNVAGVRL